MHRPRSHVIQLAGDLQDILGVLCTLCQLILSGRFNGVMSYVLQHYILTYMEHCAAWVMMLGKNLISKFLRYLFISSNMSTKCNNTKNTFITYTNLAIWFKKLVITNLINFEFALMNLRPLLPNSIITIALKQKTLTKTKHKKRRYKRVWNRRKLNSNCLCNIFLTECCVKLNMRDFKTTRSLISVLLLTLRYCIEEYNYMKGNKFKNT